MKLHIVGFVVIYFIMLYESHLEHKLSLVLLFLYKNVYCSTLKESSNVKNCVISVVASLQV